MIKAVLGIKVFFLMSSEDFPENPLCALTAAYQTAHASERAAYPAATASASVTAGTFFKE